MLIITFTAVIHSYTQADLLTCVLAKFTFLLYICSPEWFITLNTSPSFLPLSLCLHLLKGVGKFITTILAWAGIAYELRNDITHVFNPPPQLFPVSRRWNFSAHPSSHPTYVHVCSHTHTDKLLVWLYTYTHTWRHTWVSYSACVHLESGLGRWQPLKNGYITPLYQTHLCYSLIQSVSVCAKARKERKKESAVCV